VGPQVFRPSTPIQALVCRPPLRPQTPVQVRPPPPVQVRPPPPVQVRPQTPVQVRPPLPVQVRPPTPTTPRPGGFRPVGPFRPSFLPVRPNLRPMAPIPSSKLFINPCFILINPVSKTAKSHITQNFIDPCFNLINPFSLKSKFAYLLN